MPGFVLLAALSAGVALYAIVGYAVRPLGALVHPAMAASFANHAGAVYLHVFGAATALLLGPLQFLPAVRSRHPGWHRWSGRLYLAGGVLAGGLSGLYLAAHAHGGPMARTGFAALALAWLFTGLRAYVAVRRHELAAHRRWMVRNYALAFAAVTLRAYLGAGVAAGAGFDVLYAWIAWLCWVPNLALAEFALRMRARQEER